MRIVFLSEAYSKNMGYAENALPKAMARLGADVNLVVSNLPPYYYLPNFSQTYGVFVTTMGHSEVEEVDGYKVHYLPYKKCLGYVRMVGLFKKLKALRPDIVQTFATISWVPLDAALSKLILNYKLFTGCHTHTSVFPLAQRLTRSWDKEQVKCTITRRIPGRLISFLTEKCYSITSDCANIATDFFGVQKRKVEICPLGVDTDFFFPVKDEETKSSRECLRRQLGFSPSDTVCIYTGRFSEDKNPLALAMAVERLIAIGESHRALFVGDGIQADAIRIRKGCVVYPFVAFNELGRFYRAADIGVWPTQESMSMLDAAACGLPIVVNDTLVAVERIQGNGLAYKLNDVDDLTSVLRSLSNPATREQLGKFGAIKMASLYSWDSIARRRLKDYEVALGIRKGN